MFIKDNIENALISYLKGDRYINHRSIKENALNRELDGIESISVIEYMIGLGMEGSNYIIFNETY